MSRHVVDFIQELVLHFGEPKFDVGEDDRPKAHAEWLRSMARGLSSFDADVLKAASYEIISTRKYRSFPLLSECLEASYAAKKRQDAEKPRLPIKTDVGISESEALASDLVNGPLGRQAAREGWIGALFDWIRRERRLPSESWGIREIQGDARSFDAAYEACVRGEAGPLSVSLEKLGASMLKRREQLAREVLGHG